MKKKLLVPLDGSKLAERALPWAELLCSKLDAQMELLCCYEPVASVYMLPDIAVPPPVYYDQTTHHKEIDSYLNKVQSSLPQGVAVKKRCEGDPGMAIIDRASSGEIEAVVMASHGRGGLGRWLLGSIATKVVRGSSIPVLIIKAGTKVANPPRVERILVSLDGSELAESALAKAVELAGLFQSQLRLYRRVPHTPIGHPTLDAAVGLEVANAKEYIEKVRSSLSLDNVETRVEVAGPELGIVEQSKDCDLVIMASHGNSGFRRWLLGSVTERVLQTIEKPLLVVHQSQDSDF